MTPVTRPPLRALALLVLMAALIAYETNPDLQSWLNYKTLQAREWVRYARDWMVWKRHNREV